MDNTAFKPTTPSTIRRHHYSTISTANNNTTTITAPSSPDRFIQDNNSSTTTTVSTATSYSTNGVGSMATAISEQDLLANMEALNLSNDQQQHHPLDK